MQATQTEHAEALAQARGSVTKIRLMQESAAEVGGTVTDDGILVNLGSDELRFASGSANLPARQLPTLDRTAALLSARPELVARIEGHTDSSGNAEINQRLSQQRAEAVRAALIERGIDPERLVAEGAGAARPIADNATAQGRRQNRRVEIYVTAEAESDSNASNRDSG
jgi:outer membrane protein OmpA-like peptidoglycan-associated protein